MTFSSDAAIQINQLPISVELPPNYNEFSPMMTLLYKRMVNAINSKEGSIFSLQELGNFQQYFTLTNPQSFRNVYRKVFDMVSSNGGPIAPGATVTVAHNITGINACTHIYGSATNSAAPVHYLPLPYVSTIALNQQVEIYLTPTNVVVINGAGQSALTQCYVVAEYVKN